MTIEESVKDRPPRRKPIWPWLLLLILTLMAIYSWNRASEIFDDFSRNMPPAIIDLFRDLLNDHNDHGRVGPRVDVAVPVQLLLR